MIERRKWIAFSGTGRRNGLVIVRQRWNGLVIVNMWANLIGFIWTLRKNRRLFWTGWGGAGRTNRLLLVGWFYGHTGKETKQIHQLTLNCIKVCHLSSLPWLHQSCDRIVSAGYPLPSLIAKLGDFLVSVHPSLHTPNILSMETTTGWLT